MKNLDKLFDPIRNTPIIYFRVIFGIALFIETMSDISSGKVKAQWIIPINNFTYWPFDFIKPLEGDGMVYLFYAMAFLSIFITIGLFYRVSIFLFFISFAYVAFLDQSYYLNHFYLITLISLIMIFLPMNQRFAFDTRLGFSKKHDFAPKWSLNLLRFVVALPYFFGGLAKINPDWLKGQPMTMWLAKSVNLPALGYLFKIPNAGLWMSYSGLLFDLFIVPLLIWKKTRKWAMVVLLFFHIVNSQLFNIGIFPWLMLLATPIFFEHDWLDKFIFRNKLGYPVEKPLFVPLSPVKKNLIIWVLFVFVLYNILMPLRHYFIPGSVYWTEEGELFSWHMKLKDKVGKGKFYVMNMQNHEKRDLPLSNYLTPRQISIMLLKPEMMWQFAQMVKKKYSANNVQVAVLGDVQVSLNGRDFQTIIKPDVDLVTAPRPGWGVDWIMPMTAPLKSIQ